MTDTEMRIAIAEACPDVMKGGYTQSGMPMAHVMGDDFKPLDFVHDLNACAEMRKTMKPHERRLFIEYLFESMPPAEYMWRAYMWNLVDASARAQCKAFLQMKGLLTDDKEKELE